MKRRTDTDINIKKTKSVKPIIICCLCAKMGDKVKLISIFSEASKINCLNEKIMKYTPFKVVADDDLHQHICGTCTSEINHWHEFIQSCIEAQKDIKFSTFSREVFKDPDLKKKNIEIKSSLPSEQQHNVRNVFITGTSMSCQDVNCNKAEAVQKKNEESLRVSSKCIKALTNNSSENLSVNKTESNSSTNKSANMELKTRGTYCIARWCGNNAKNPGISLFRIPKDRDRALSWLTNAEREDLKILSPQALHTKYLCMDHFSDDMFMNSTKKKLVWNAVPKLFSKPDYALKKESRNSSLQSNIVFPAQQIFISNFQQLVRQRPIRPKPINADQGNTKHCAVNTSNKQVQSSSKTLDESQSVEGSSEMNNMQGTVEEKTVNEDSIYGLGKTIVVQNNKTNKKSDIKISARPEKCIYVNETVTLKEGNVQIVELPPTQNLDIIKRYENNCASGSDNRKSTNENYNFMSEESYLNCEADALCLGHTYRETNERIYPCQYCGEMFLVKSNLISHQTTYHSDRPVGCESCGKVLYRSRSEFMEHVCDSYIESTQDVN